MTFGTAAAPQPPAGVPSAASVGGSGGATPSATRMHAIVACNDAIQIALASGATSFTESLTKQATTLLADPFTPLLASIAATTDSNSNTVGGGFDRRGEEGESGSVLYEPYHEAAHIGSGLLSLLLHTSRANGGGGSTTQHQDNDHRGGPADLLLASIAPTVVSSIVRFLSKGDVLPTPPPVGTTASSASGGNTSSAFIGHGGHSIYGHGSKAHPLLLASQALFLLTRRYQCTEQHVRELAALMEVLLDTLHNFGVSRGSSLNQLHDADATQNMCAIAYLSSWSLCNAIACWNDVTRTGASQGSTTTTRTSNQLLSSATVGVFIDEWLRKTINRLVTGSSGAGVGGSGMIAGGGLGGGTSFLSPRDGTARRSMAPSGGAGHPHSGQPRSPGELHHHHSSHTGNSNAAATCLPLAFLPLVQLALGAFLVAKRDVEKGCDAIVAACLAHHRSGSAGSVSGGGALEGVAGLGKVFKRMRQLAPSEELLAIPVALVAEAPFLLISFLLDDALPAMHHVADLDLRSYHQFLERQREEELAALQGSQFNNNNHNNATAARRGGGASAMYNNNYGGHMMQQPLHQHGGSSGASMSNPFAYSCGFAHCISAMAWCLSHLPPHYAATMPVEHGGDDADGDETAIAFFTFRNGPAHLRAIFELQRQDALWEPFAHKTAAAFLELLAVLCRHPVTADRVTQLLAESQMDCTELQWSALFAQARECAGLSQLGSTTAALLQAPPPQATSHVALRQASHTYLRKQQERFLLETLRLFRAIVEASQAPHKPVAPDGLPGLPHDASTLVALQQLISLDIGFAFLQSDRLTPTGLGDVLSLIGFLIRTPADAERVWAALEDAGLLRPPSTFTSSAPATTRSAASVYTGQQRNHPNSDGEGAGQVALSLLAHVQREVHVGDHPITRGFLSLLYGVLRHLQPTQATHFASVSAVMKFVAEDITAGSRKRAYAKREEGLVVLALSCAVLSQASTLPFAQQQGGASQQQQNTYPPAPSSSLPQSNPSASSSSSSSAVSTFIPMNTLTASFKAPADVLGDVLDAIYTLATKSFAQHLSSVEVSLLRQALEFLKHIMGGGGGNNSNNHKREIGFPVEARTSSNSDFVVSLLKLVASCDDPVVAQDSIALLSLLTSGALSQATRHLMMRVDVSYRLRDAFAMLLDPQTVNQTTLRVYHPLRMLSKWHEGQATVPGYEVRTMSLFLDLMVKCATMPHPSLFSWLIGCQLHHQRMPTAPSAGQDASSGGNQADDGAAQSHRYVCLEAIVRGANDKELATTRALVHTKFIRLLFLLKAHNEEIRNHAGIAANLQARSAESYLSWVLHCGGNVEETAESIAQHGLCLKTIALDAYRACLSSGRGNASASRGARGSSAATSSNALRIMQRLLADSSTNGLNAVQYDGRGIGGGAGNAAYGSGARTSSSMYPLERFRSKLDDEDEGVDDGDDEDVFTSLSPFRDWPAHVLRALEVFPNLPVPPGGLEQYVRVTPDGTPRYAIEELYRAFIALAHAEIVDRGGSSPSQSQLEEVLRQRLVPYLDANRCLMSYASALVFVEGWTNLIEVGTSLNNAPTTAAASAGAYQEATAAAAMVAGGGADAGAVNHLTVIVNALSTEELLRYLHSIMEAIDATSNFTVAAQEQIASTLSRAVTAIVGRLKQVVDAARGGGQHHHHHDPHDGSHQQQWNRSDVQRTLSAILNTLCLVGSRSATLRADLYNSLVMFLTLKHLPVDQILLFRAQSMLFSLLLNDINELAAPTLQLAALNCLRIVLERSPQLCDTFCGAQNGAGGCAPTLSQFAASAIASVEEIVMDVLLHGSRDIAIASYIVQSIFDIFVRASQQHADAVYRANAFALCNRMQVWPVGTRQMLDAMSGLTSATASATTAASDASATNAARTAQGFAADLRATSQMLHTGAHALLQRTVIGVLRWYNTSIRSLLPFEDAISQLADLVNAAQLLLQLAASPGVLHAVQQQSNAMVASHPSASQASAAVISVIYEVSELLLNFSNTVLAPQCSSLITTFAVPNLIIELIRKESRATIASGAGAVAVPGGTAGSSRGASYNAPSSTAAGGSHPHHQQKLQRLLGLARAARNLVLFLANADSTVPAASGVAGQAPGGRSSVAIAQAAPVGIVVPVNMHVDILHHLSMALRDVAPLPPTGGAAGRGAGGGSTTDVAHDALQLAYVQAIEATVLMLTQAVAAAASKASSLSSSNLSGAIASASQATTVAITEVRQQRFLRQRPGAQEVPSTDHDLRAGTTFADLAAEFKGAVSPSPCNNTHSSGQHQLFVTESLNVERALQKAEVAVASLVGAAAATTTMRR